MKSPDSHLQALPIEAMTDPVTTTTSRIQKAQRLLSRLSSPEVVAFIDANKLTESSAFVDMVEMAVAHAQRNGNTHYASQLVAALEGSRHQKALAMWFCSRLGLKLVEKGGQRRLAKDAGAQIAWHPLSKVFPVAVASRDRELAVQAYETKLSRLRVVVVSSKDRRIDMLDAPGRLHGSFEGGKRR